MSLSTSIVDIDSILAGSKLVPFDPKEKQTEIEALAYTVIELKGLFKIPIVRALGIDEYELVSGHLEYYAFLKARELDSTLADRIAVFILRPNNEKAVLKQIQVSQSVEQLILNDKSLPPGDGIFSLGISNLESQLDLFAKDLNLAMEKLKVEILAAIDAKLPQPLPLLEAFNRILEPAVQEKVFRQLMFLGRKKATKIIEILKDYRQKHKSEEFKRFDEVLNALGKGTLSKAKFLEVIDYWGS
jgi:hypothetical protein